VSRAFVKEGDGESAEPVVFGAALPAGTPNLATPWSADALRRRLAAAKAERESLRDAGSGTEAARKARLDAEIRGLEPYVATLQVVEPPARPERVGFGVEVDLDGEVGPRTIAIVGVDEVDPAHGRVSFLSPLANALFGLAPGDVAAISTPRGSEEVEIVALRPLSPRRTTRAER
jgi:transcription elongation factor GreB